jgi:hypothetical protein
MKRLKKKDGFEANKQFLVSSMTLNFSVSK